ncbi:MAG: T9SS type A sorting domain-containing protein [Cryomorphaceae bacterium]|nr:T9SS type A sorting domain-containing protein [Cryomorphaceae bacterium]
MNRNLTFLILSLPSFLFAQWVQIPSPTANDLDNLYFINDTVGFAGYGNSEIVTYDGGRSWSYNSGFTNLVKACYLDSLNGFGITQNAIYQTNDGGVNWFDISDSLKINLFSTLNCVNGEVFVVGNKGLQDTGYWYVTSDIGITWELRYMTDSMLYGEAQFLDNQNIFSFSASGHGSQGNLMYHFNRSMDGGYSWDTYSFSPGISSSYLIYCNDYDTCAFAQISSHWGQFSFGIDRFIFSTKASSPLHSEQGKGLHFLEGGHQTLFAGETDFLIVSPDRGVTWFNQNISFLTGFQKSLYKCHVFSDSSAIITGGNGSIIFTENFGLGLVDYNTKSPSFSVFPNPANDHQDISVTGLTPGTTCKIELFDLRGKKAKEVFAGNSPDNTLNIRVNLSDLAAGTYVYRVQTEEGVTRRKVVVN